MTDMKNGDFTSGYPEFEIPITAGQMLKNLVCACTKGILLDEPDFKCQTIKNIFGYTELEISLSDNSSLYHMYNFEPLEPKKYLMSISLKYLPNNGKIYIKVNVSENVKSDDILFQNFVENSGLRWVEKDIYMGLEPMAMQYRAVKPYGFKTFESSFECRGSLYIATVNTTESGHVSAMVVVIERNSL